MFKEDLLKEILNYCERKGKFFFTYEEFLVFLFHKYGYRVSFGSVMRKLRKLARQGFLIRKKVPLKEWGIGQKVYFFPQRAKIRIWLKKRNKY